MNTTRKIRVLLVDDHALVRQGFGQLINMQDDMEVVGECSRGEEVERALQCFCPDLVLMDIMMKGMDGIETTRAIKARQPEIGVIMLSMLEREECILEAFRAGANGYLFKDVSVEELVRAIRLVHAGEALVYPRGAGNLISRFMARADSNRGEERARNWVGLRDLSAHHKRLLDMVSQGMTNKEIAAELGLSEVTVKSHLRRICGRLGALDRASAVASALRSGIIR